ncbi:MAG: C39 family peptidase [Candidatus Aenigmarchaeota archaeon]|nr:C39 family peptidase [Candidatus Aenigmarchaeota archaeon]
MLKIKPFKQTKGYCGPASLKMLLSYYGIDKSEDYLAKLVGASRETGCGEDGLMDAGKKLGFKAYSKVESSIEELKELIEKGIPVMVAWFSPEENGHYSLVIGFEKNKIVMNDPHFGKEIKMDIKQFLIRWFDFDNYPIKDCSELGIRRIIVIQK